VTSRPTRTLIDAGAFGAIAWMWVAIYQSFTHTGLWPYVERALGGAPTLPSQAAVLASCVLIGWLALATACWLIWHVFLRRHHPDFPAACVVSLDRRAMIRRR